MNRATLEQIREITVVGNHLFKVADRALLHLRFELPDGVKWNGYRDRYYARERVPYQSRYSDSDHVAITVDVDELNESVRRYSTLFAPVHTSFAALSDLVFPVDAENSAFYLSAAQVISNVADKILEDVSHVKQEFECGRPQYVALNRTSFIVAGLPYWRACFAKECIRAHLKVRERVNTSKDGGIEADLDKFIASTKSFRAGLIGRQRQIFEVIEEAGHRVTTDQIIDLLASQKRVTISSGSIKNTLALLRKAGYLTNDRNATPPGYGLPEWG